MQSVKSDAALIDELYRRNSHTILRFVRRQISSLEEAEDIVLEVFIAALESNTLLKLNEQEQQAWLHRVAYNKCIDYYRRTVRKQSIPLDLLVDNVYDEDERAPDNVTVQQEEYHRLREHLTLLTEQQREVLRLKFGDDLRSPEIARRLNKSESAVRMMLARTLNFLRDIYAKNEDRGEC